MMKIAFSLSENEMTIDGMLNALQEFKAMGAETVRCVNSIEEELIDGEKCAVFEFEPLDGVLNILVHNNTIINFVKKEN